MKKLLAFFSVILMAGSLYAKEVTLLMDWFPQGNQSGYWQAQFDNQYHDDVGKYHLIIHNSKVQFHPNQYIVHLHQLHQSSW